MKHRSGRSRRSLSTVGLAALLCLMTMIALDLPTRAAAQDTPADEGFRYNNLWEISGQLLYTNPQNGTPIANRANIGGGRAAGTQWLTPRWGATGDLRYIEGLGNALPNPYGVNSPLMTQAFFTGGGEWRWIRTSSLGVSLHGLAGGVYGKFDGHVPAGVSNSTLGLYPTGMTVAMIAGGNIDFVRSQSIAIRITPDLVATHFGNQFQETFSIGAGIVWHFGKY
jgi:hypothetical protein